jgi:3-methyladenine DNA glycosylase AlkD
MAAVAARSRHAQAKAQQWTRSTNEWRARVGWSIMAQLAMHDESLPDAYLEKLLESIQRDIGASKNYVRHAMNSALIAIGIRNAKLKRQAIAAAKKIGTVEVDHGETGCKTPEAVPYIEKSWARKQATGKARLRTC